MDHKDSDEAGYSPAAKWLHWLIALMVTGLIPVGMIMGNLPRGAFQDRLFISHESFGVTVLGLMVARLAIRIRAAPPPYPALTRADRAVSTGVQHALYLLLFVVPLLGWLGLSAYGLGPAFFGLGELPHLIGKDENLSKLIFKLHGLGGFLIAGLVAFHIAGAIFHALIKRDRLLFRMLPTSWR